MNWELATDDELWNIIANDCDIPGKLIEELITESLNRNLFDHLIKHLIIRSFPSWDKERKYNISDLYSIGYIGIVQAMKKYHPGKCTFKTFAYMNVKSEFLDHIEKRNADKRKVYDNIVSLNVQKYEDNSDNYIDSLLDYTQNPERVAINKVYLETELGKLTERERKVLVYFSEGYSMHEIANKLNISVWPIHKDFHSGINKINPSAGKVKLKELGLTTWRKGVIA